MINSEKVWLSIVIPIYNEEKRIKKSYEKVLDYLKNKPFVWEILMVNDDYSPDIVFQKLNPTKYRVRVTKASEPFFLVFSESYHSQWKAYVNRTREDLNWFETFFQRPIPEEKHFVGNGYANAWYVNKTGTYDITLDYQLQKVFRYGVVISLITLLISILYLTKVNPVQWVQKKYKR